MGRPGRSAREHRYAVSRYHRTALALAAQCGRALGDNSRGGNGSTMTLDDPITTPPGLPLTSNYYFLLLFFLITLFLFSPLLWSRECHRTGVTEA
jgi:hypothetical protein